MSLILKLNSIIPFSTGVIGQQLDLSNFESGIPRAVSQLSDSSINEVAKGILTTDLVEKSYSISFEVDGKTVTLTGIAKGSGMIRPDMATMLSFVFTDIGASHKKNCKTVYHCQSTNHLIELQLMVTPQQMTPVL